MTTACRAEVTQLITLYEGGVPSGNTTLELGISDVAAVVDAGKAVIDALTTIAKDGLKAVNDVQARAHMKTFIDANASGLQKVEQEVATKGQLQLAWDRRKAFVLLTEYSKFTALLKLPKQDRAAAADGPRLHPETVRAKALKISAELATYDAMRTTKPPGEVIDAWGKAAAQVKTAVDSSDVSIQAIADYLAAEQKTFATIQADYATVKSMFDTFVKDVTNATK